MCIRDRYIEGNFIPYFIASIFVAIYAEVMARVNRAPAPIFLTAAAVPLIPGGSLYYTMAGLVNGDESMLAESGSAAAVSYTHLDVYKRQLIYRGNRLINWCPQCKTSLSDAEVEHEDRNGKYWYFRYPAADGGEGIVVATSRPETMFADEAIAVHPDDDRYKDMVGKKVILPLMGKEIPVIADTYPDPEKGTGAVDVYKRQVYRRQSAGSIPGRAYSRCHRRHNDPFDVLP